MAEALKHYDVCEFGNWKYLGTSERYQPVSLARACRKDVNTPEVYLKDSYPHGWGLFPPGAWRHTSALNHPDFAKQSDRFVITTKEHRSLYAVYVRENMFTYDGEDEPAWVLIRPGFVLERHEHWRDLIENIGEDNIFRVVAMVDDEVFAISTRMEVKDVRAHAK